MTKNMGATCCLWQFGDYVDLEESNAIALLNLKKGGLTALFYACVPNLG